MQRELRWHRRETKRDFNDLAALRSGPTTGEGVMVAYIKSDLEFILEQIKIAEAHAAGQPAVWTGRPDSDLQPRLGPADGRWDLQ